MTKVPARFHFLGTGSSMGVPVIGCHCPVCSSSLTVNKRFRSSCLISYEDKKILIDCGPDFRQQALRKPIEDLDALLVTHAHYDHIAGLDELRVFSICHDSSMPCLASQETAAALISYFPYIFLPKDASYKYALRINFQYLKDKRGVSDFAGLAIQHITYEQAGMQVNGFRFGNLAYISDIYSYPETIFEDLHGIEILIIGTLRFTPSLYSLSVDEAIEFARRVGAKEIWLTHIAHELDHDKTNAYLPSNIRMAYDSLEIDFEADKI